MQMSIFCAEEPLVSLSPSPDSERDWMILVATSCSPLVQLLADIGPAGWYGRTSPVSCQVTEDETLVPSSGCWANSGMGSPTEFWTLNTLEFHSAAAACSLSDILETGDVPQRFYLSATACRGILRRAEKRGRDLPPTLLQALQQVAGVSEGSEIPEGKTRSSRSASPQEPDGDTTQKLKQSYRSPTPSKPERREPIRIAAQAV